jgi:hypothetical protein
MMEHIRSTRDHDTIKTWASKHGACPTILVHKNDHEPQLYFTFNNAVHKTINPTVTSWEGFFQIFEKEGFSFIYTDEPAHTKHPFFRFMKKY